MAALIDVKALDGGLEELPFRLVRNFGQGSAKFNDGISIHVVDNLDTRRMRL